MASSNFADLSGTASPELQNWDAEWAAAENGKSYWDDYISQITIAYEQELEDIELALETNKTQIEAEIVDIKPSLQELTAEYEALIESINQELQNDLDRLQGYYNDYQDSYDFEVSTANSEYDPAIEEINLTLEY